MGGTLVNEHVVQAADWRVRLIPMEPFRLGSLEVGQTRLEIEVEEKHATEFLERFAKKHCGLEANNFCMSTNTTGAPDNGAPV